MKIRADKEEFVMNPHNRSENNKGATLRAVETQINLLVQMLEESARSLRFRGDIERHYLEHRNQRFLDVDVKIIAGGLLVYMLFSWTDFYFGRDKAQQIFVIRSVITGLMFALLVWLPTSRFQSFIVPVTAAGICVIGISVMYFIYLLEGLPRYAYHLGLIPIQVFAMVSMRLSYRAFLVTSGVMLLMYGVISAQIDLKTDPSELGRIIISLQPYFMAFWFVLIVMGAYLAYFIEEAFRNEYMKNRLLALEAERLGILTQRLQHLSTTDSLTQLANRRHFERAFNSEWRRCQRTAEPLVLIMVDVDAFKQYNDTYGHQMGDECLRKVAATMASGCRRASDLCARYGGEEFAILLPHTTKSEAIEWADNIRLRIQELNIPHRGNDCGVVTISAGVACQVPDNSSEAEGLIRQADQWLYHAKSMGRNRVGYHH